MVMSVKEMVVGIPVTKSGNQYLWRLKRVTDLLNKRLIVFFRKRLASPILLQ